MRITIKKQNEHVVFFSPFRADGNSRATSIEAPNNRRTHETATTSRNNKPQRKTVRNATLHAALQASIRSRNSFRALLV